ncbi:hypothetical protein [Roseovarius sp. MMSF_3281]|uniref:hypothetical protein n=1 Tax=Roseovarius sp. MMSF_3281 TaxID=3046694 RepID=UPI00273D4F36|nr:hypothetical protein [Roseovarius sp. MMSF_3281]
MRFPIHSLRKPLIFALLTGILSACETPEPDLGVVNRLSSTYVEAQHEYRFARNAASLSGTERSKIAKFLHESAPREGDSLIVTIPSSGLARVDSSRMRTMRAALALVPSRKTFNMTENFGARPKPATGTGILRLVRPSGIDADCRPGLDALGCANASNLSAMVHQPGDVLGPRATARIAHRQAAP